MQLAGADDRKLAGGDVPGLVLRIGADGGQQDLALVGHTAADADDLRLERVDDVGDADADILDPAVDDLPGGLVTLGSGIKGQLGVDVVDVLGHLPHNGVLVGLHGGLRLAGQRAGGGVALPAAPASAGALDAVLDNDVVTHFTGGEVEAAQNLAAQDNAAADAGA